METGLMNDKNMIRQDYWHHIGFFKKGVITARWLGHIGVRVLLSERMMIVAIMGMREEMQYLIKVEGMRLGHSHKYPQIWPGLSHKKKK